MPYWDPSWGVSTVCYISGPPADISTSMPDFLNALKDGREKLNGYAEKYRERSSRGENPLKVSTRSDSPPRRPITAVKPLNKLHDPHDWSSPPRRYYDANEDFVEGPSYQPSHESYTQHQRHTQIQTHSPHGHPSSRFPSEGSPPREPPLARSPPGSPLRHSPQSPQFGPHSPGFSNRKSFSRRDSGSSASSRRPQLPRRPTHSPSESIDSIGASIETELLAPAPPKLPRRPSQSSASPSTLNTEHKTKNEPTEPIEPIESNDHTDHIDPDDEPSLESRDPVPITAGESSTYWDEPVSSIDQPSQERSVRTPQRSSAEARAFAPPPILGNARPSHDAIRGRIMANRQERPIRRAAQHDLHRTESLRTKTRMQAADVPLSSRNRPPPPTLPPRLRTLDPEPVHRHRQVSHETKSDNRTSKYSTQNGESLPGSNDDGLPADDPSNASSPTAQLGSLSLS